MLVLLHCGCGFWGCAAIVARVEETENGLIQWKIGHYRWDDTISEFFFRKDEYVKTMAEIQKAAEEDIKKNENSQ